MTKLSITWILFDLGNVLVDHVPDGTRRIAEHLRIDLDTLHEYLIEIDASRRLCTGELGAEAFVGLVNTKFGSSVTPAMITEWFGPEVERVYPEIPLLIASLSGRYRLGILSNTFFGHWDYFETTDLARMFEAAMPSHLLGFVKPDPLIYREALRRINARPEETLFIDDKDENVAGAIDAGMHSFRSLSPAETVGGLRKLGIV